ncbi:hypothetical protein GOP47_0028980 [Adiantum capillus-veneris]|nr:hypothetical protein GOP47_0028980 [Adiantum capillus-veneris]
MSSYDGDDDEALAMELAYFRNAVENLNVSTQEVNNSTCLRFLKARSMNISKAAKMYVQYCTWRASFVPLGHIPAEEVISELNANKCGLQGYSKKGHPLLIGLGGKHYPSKNNLDTFKRYVVHLLDKSIASAPAGVEKIIVIVDLKHLGYKNVDVKGYIAAFQLLQNYFPERLAALYMVNVPRFFHGVWKVISCFLDQATKEKIVFVEDHLMAEVLLSQVDAATLPSSYGGKADIVLLQDVCVPNWPRPVSTPA